MMSRIKRLVLELLDSHRVMTLATNRADGWPQATMVGYVNDGFLVYCWAARNAQKCANIRRDSRVSAAIGSDAPRPLDIKGLSLAGKAAFVADEGEATHVLSLRRQRYPEYAALPPLVLREGPEQRLASDPSPGAILLRIAPEIISVLDYSKGFGHSDLVTFSERDLDVHLQSVSHDWQANDNAPETTSSQPA
jgi:nitroimidazol reductase NimA-like FMN-containing flavoprotein (pyridoxamine 5'-phosphate oxidase superfamily)